MALLRQIIRRGVKNLTVVDSGVTLDLLIAAGCVRKVVSYYAGGGFGVPVAPAFRRAVERGEIEVWECEEGILTTGLQAAAQALPFLPWRGGVGTSLPDVNKELKVIQDPIRGETLIAVPPIKPDVALLHAATADAYGNVQHCGGPGCLICFSIEQRTVQSCKSKRSFPTKKSEQIRGQQLSVVQMRSPRPLWCASLLQSWLLRAG